MALIHVIREEKARSLSDRTIWCLIAINASASVGLMALTMYVLWGAGYAWLCLIVVGPLGTGLLNSGTEWVRYCRPHWFKPLQVEEDLAGAGESPSGLGDGSSTRR